MHIIVAFGTSTQTSTTEVLDKICILLSEKSLIIAFFSLAHIFQCKRPTLNGKNISCNDSKVFIAFAKSIFSDSSTKGLIQKACLHFSSSLLIKFSTCFLSFSFFITFVKISFLHFGYSFIILKS